MASVGDLQEWKKAFNVYNADGKLIDTVWFTGYNALEAKASLVNHDGYSPDIFVIDQTADAWFGYPKQEHRASRA